MFWLLLLISIVVAAFIGGVTNHLAIKMLFFPYEEKRLFGWRIPFTPGIIPKRRGEIAGSFGRIVSHHLITSDGLRRWLQKPEFRAQLQTFLDRKLAAWLQNDESVEQFARRFLTQEQVAHLQERLAGWLRGKANGLLQTLWEEKGFGDRPLADMLGGWSEEKRIRLASRLTGTAFEELEKGLRSAGGTQFLRRMVEQLIERIAGDGLIAGVVKSFLNVESLTAKLQQALLDKLDEPATLRLAEDWLCAKMAEWERLTLADVLRTINGKDGRVWLQEQLLDRVPWEELVTDWSKVPVSSLLRGEDGVPLVQSQSLVDVVLRLLEQNVESLMGSLDLAKLVEEQVARFPIEQIERMILDVSGREFRAITWLGALLGGLIGLVQYLLLSLF